MLSGASVGEFVLNILSKVSIQKMDAILCLYMPNEMKSCRICTLNVSWGNSEMVS